MQIDTFILDKVLFRQKNYNSDLTLKTTFNKLFLLLEIYFFY